MLRSMFRSVAIQSRYLTTTAVCASAGKHPQKTNVEEHEEYFVKYFSNPKIDNWEIRKGINDVFTYDVIPEPTVAIEVLKACRRLNDHSLAVRFLEGYHYKCGIRHAEVWPWIMQEIRPTLDELGVSSFEDLGWDKPELAVEDVSDM